jgi:hypothetical protein
LRVFFFIVLEIWALNDDICHETENENEQLKELPEEKALGILLPFEVDDHLNHWDVQESNISIASFLDKHHETFRVFLNEPRHVDYAVFDLIELITPLFLFFFLFLDCLFLFFLPFLLFLFLFLFLFLLLQLLFLNQLFIIIPCRVLI